MMFLSDWQGKIIRYFYLGLENGYEGMDAVLPRVSWGSWHWGIFLWQEVSELGIQRGMPPLLEFPS